MTRGSCPVRVRRRGMGEPSTERTIVTSEDRPMARVRKAEELSSIPSVLGLETGRPVLVCVGGAGGMGQDDLKKLTDLVTGVLVGALDTWGAVVIDGGTDSGVMRVLGRSREAAGGRFPLVGVAAEETVVLEGQAQGARAPLE